MASERAAVGQEQQALAVEIETADGDDARQLGRQGREHRRAPLRVAVGGHEPLRLVVAPELRGFGAGERLAVDQNLVFAADLEGWRVEDLAVDADAALPDPALGLAARAQPCPRHRLGDAQRLTLGGVGRGGSDLRARALARAVVWHGISDLGIWFSRGRPLMTPHEELDHMPPQTSVQVSPMERALAEAQAAGARGEVPIGAVVTASDGTIIAAAGNRTRELSDPTAHAEMLVIRAACASLGSRAACRLRPLRHARALPHVRGRDLLCSHPPPLLRRTRPQGRRGGARRARLQPDRPATTRRRSTRASTKSAPRCC